jgi:hypothetical protein
MFLMPYHSQIDAVFFLGIKVYFHDHILYCPIDSTSDLHAQVRRQCRGDDLLNPCAGETSSRSMCNLLYYIGLANGKQVGDWNLNVNCSNVISYHIIVLRSGITHGRFSHKVQRHRVGEGILLLRTDEDQLYLLDSLPDLPSHFYQV